MTRSRRFPCRPEAVAGARRFVRRTLADEPSELVATAELMTSELATNCVLHARTEFELVVRRDREIRVEVRDLSVQRPTLRSPTAGMQTGRGLRIVEALSGAWGVIPSATGKTVWFALAAPLGIGDGDGGSSASAAADTAVGVDIPASADLAPPTDPAVRAEPEGSSPHRRGGRLQRGWQTSSTTASRPCASVRPSGRSPRTVPRSRSSTCATCSPRTRPGARA